jgi:hypothetical protein
MSPDAISSSPLPPSLRVVYQTYKNGTATLVNWLVLRGLASDATGDTKPTRLVVRRIIELATEIAQRSIAPPQQIRDAFNVALVNRRRLTKYYKEEVDPLSQATAKATARHQFFNETLAQAYDILFPHKGPPSHEHSSLPPVEETSEQGEPRSRLEILSECIEQRSDYTEDIPTLSVTDDKRSIAQPSAIEDDPLEDVIALHAYVLEIEETISTLRNIWASAAKGDIPVTFAGWLTNFGYEMIRTMASESALVPKTHEELVERYVLTKYYLLSADATNADFLDEQKDFEDEVSNYDAFRTDLGLMCPYYAISNFFRIRQLNKSFMAARDRQALPAYFGSRSQQNEILKTFTIARHALQREFYAENMDEDTYDEEWLALFSSHCSSYQSRVDSILRSAVVRTRDNTTISGHFDAHENMPLCDEVNFYSSTLAHKQPQRSELVFGLHILLGSCTAFLWNNKDDTLNRTSCRIQALKLVIEISSTAKEVIVAADDRAYCECTAFNERIICFLRQLIKELAEYQKQPSFDLYSQSPWVAGSQMSLMLGSVQDVGLVLLNMRGYFGGILHLFNMLQQCKVENVDLPVVEGLCQMFQQEVFMDASLRPNKNFASIITRFCGGTVKVVKGKGASMVFPDVRRNAPTSGGVDLRIDCEHISLFTNCFAGRFKGSPAFWRSMVDKGKLLRSHKKPELNGDHDMSKAMAENSIPELLAKAETYVGREFTGPYPIARVNFLKLYLDCLEVWKDIAFEYQELVPEEHQHGPRFHICSAFNQLYSAAKIVDQRIQDKKLVVTLKEYYSLVMMRDSLVKVFAGKKMEDYYWKEI